MAWSKSTRISIMLAIDVVFFVTELTVGLLVKSLALLADAFHMLNDIISLCVGLWAVAVASKATTDKYSYGWLRAEILGAFFNAVFLIALCVSIILEAISRFFDPPDIQNPQLILIVGSIGLASNLVGFLVLGGHGHDHGHGDHDHDHGDGEHDHHHSHEHAAEEGRVTVADRNNYAIANDDGPAIDVLPEVAVARATEGGPTTPRRIRFDSESGSPSNRGSSNTRGRERERRRASSLRHSRLTSIDDISIYPSSFRQEIIDASRPRPKDMDGTSKKIDAAPLDGQALHKFPRDCLHAYGIHSATIQPEFLSSAENALIEDTAALALDGAGDHVVVRKTSCLLECVDDCVGKGCCSTGTTVASSSPQSHHSHSPGESPHRH
ncbi:hypothetical protein BN1723_009212 [Verticillium longisporum]|uniref:Cation efflux protein transmembrane domain-containing protein n=1 Tax=Verticillium longisporum TaxID=100787 RepID=A0A0G4KNH3_VERLO|nr:hypothetical protein BN1723_009212 [Verticillium longisporum]